jgi:hydroxyethylthiazole kinase-like uncharacterized protein yjeF
MAIDYAESEASALFSVAQIRAIETAALAEYPPSTLMQRAGHAVAQRALAMLGNTPQPQVLIFAGPGNNGGDALVAATALADASVKITIVLFANPEQLPTDAASAYQTAVNAGLSIMVLPQLDTLDSLHNTSWSLAIDGLFGIGLSRPPQALLLSAIHCLNTLPCPILAIDVPSGLNADTGALCGDSAVQADCTLSFLADKVGLHTGYALDYSGEILVDALQLDPSAFEPPFAHKNHLCLFRHALPQRRHSSHKGSFGKLHILGGASGMGGAVLLAARMGLMAGAGRVYAGFLNQAPSFDFMHPEVMCRSAEHLDWSEGAAVVGPGLGMTSEAQGELARALESSLSLVLDADALNLIAANPSLQKKLIERSAPSLLTPHPLEAARLLNTTVQTVQSDRVHSALALAREYQACVILKGSGSIIATASGKLIINNTGNPSLASPGTGDVLAGLCGALLAQGMPTWEAALAAVYCHGAAADVLLSQGSGPAGLTASELMPIIRTLINRYTSGGSTCLQNL